MGPLLVLEESRRLRSSSGDWQKSNQPWPTRALPAEKVVGHAAMGQVVVADYVEGRQEILKTAPAGPCVVLVAYEPSTRQGGIAHISSAHDPKKSLDRFVEQLPASPSLQWSILGGQSDSDSSRHILTVLAENLPQAPGQLLQQDVLGEGSRCVGLDLADGTVFSYERDATSPQRDDRRGRTSTLPSRI